MCVADDNESVMYTGSMEQYTRFRIWNFEVSSAQKQMYVLFSLQFASVFDNKLAKAVEPKP